MKKQSFTYPFEDGIVCGFTIEDKIENEKQTIQAITQKYMVGIYLALYSGSNCVFQGGYKNYKMMNKDMKHDIEAAHKRGAKIINVQYKTKQYYEEESL